MTVKTVTTACFVILGLASATRSYAYDYQGHILTGAYVSSEKLPAEVNGSSDNNSVIFSNRAFLDVTRIGATQYEILVDIRDNHDFFDKVDTERLQLEGANTFRLRQLALRDPGVVHPYFWSVGRFLPADNNVIYNDGAEAGIRLTPTNKVGVFAGYRPRVNDEQAVELDAAAYQAGVYEVYQNDGASWDDARYMSNMLVYAPKFYADTPVESLALVNQSLFHLGPANRVTTYLNLQARPEARAEDAVVSVDRRFSSKLSGTLVASRIDLTEYRNQRDIFETLAPTAYEQAKVTGRYRLNDIARLEGNLLFGERTADRLEKYEASGGSSFTRLAGGHVTAAAFLGYRRGFISKDVFATGSVTRFTNDWELSGDLRLTQQNRDDGRILHQIVAATNVGRSFSRMVSGTLGTEFAKDENVTIISGLVTVGYRFGNREFTPLRDIAPPNTRF